MSNQGRRYVRFGAVIVVIVVSLGYLAYTGVQDSKSYYVTIKELNGMGTAPTPSGCAWPEMFARIDQAAGHPSGIPTGRTGPDAARRLQRHRSSARHLQGQRAGIGRGQVWTRRRLPCQPIFKRNVPRSTRPNSPASRVLLRLRMGMLKRRH